MQQDNPAREPLHAYRVKLHRSLTFDDTPPSFMYLKYRAYGSGRERLEDPDNDLTRTFDPASHKKLLCSYYCYNSEKQTKNITNYIFSPIHLQKNINE